MLLTKKVLAVLAVLAAIGAPAAIHAATRPEASSRQDELVTCPLTGEEIPPCCCPLNGGAAR